MVLEILLAIQCEYLISFWIARLASEKTSLKCAKLFMFFLIALILEVCLSASLDSQDAQFHETHVYQQESHIFFCIRALFLSLTVECLDHSS